MPRKKLTEEIADFHKKNNVYGYAVHFPTYTLHYAVLSLTEKEAQDKVKAQHPGLPITYLYQANRIIL